MKLPFNLTSAFIRENHSLGIDIGSASIKACKFKISKGSAELYGFGMEQAGEGLPAVLSGAFKNHNTTTANISVSGPSTLIRYVNFPKMSVGELKQALKFEAQKYIPFPMNEVILDGFILKDGLADGKMLVLLAAVKKEFMSQRLKVMEQAGLKAGVVDIDSLALVNAFNFNYSPDDVGGFKTIALLNVGSAVTNLSILEGGSPRFSRDIYIAGNNFTQKISDTLGVDFKTAEMLKLAPDKDKFKEIKSAVESVVSNLASEIRISFDYHESQSASSTNKIFLSGGGAQFSGFQDMLANLLGIEVAFWDPFKKIEIANNIDSQKLKILATRFAVAVGLALR